MAQLECKFRHTILYVDHPHHRHLLLCLPLKECGVERPESPVAEHARELISIGDDLGADILDWSASTVVPVDDAPIVESLSGLVLPRTPDFGAFHLLVVVTPMYPRGCFPDDEAERPGRPRADEPGTATTHVQGATPTA